MPATVNMRRELDQVPLTEYLLYLAVLMFEIILSLLIHFLNREDGEVVVVLLVKGFIDKLATTPISPPPSFKD